ncbi:hypothetical protein [Cellulomonas aerilata]|uniref:Uncharacterized protein n=1 Tax=Cellulomonas aerilata TaxID=515326 RepID=A0A512DBJ6_9CELL|nr:hypothetical protein [Cellulomonas aerilata]GEO33767.1 hypothetical protein CAE01nite_14920 [Cellulomonas aerilata]
MTTYHARLNSPLGRRSLEDFEAEVDSLPGEFTRGPAGDVQGQTATVLVTFAAADEAEAERIVGLMATGLSSATAHLVQTTE